MEKLINTSHLKKTIIDGDVFLTTKKNPRKGQWYLCHINKSNSLQFSANDLDEEKDVIEASTLPLEGVCQMERKDA